MRIVQLGPYPPPHGGIQSHIVALRSYLRSQGLACDVINLTSTRRPDSDGVYYPATALSVARRLLTGRYDVIHLHIGGDLTPRLLALCFFCAMIPRSRGVLTLHSGGYPSSSAGSTARPATLRGLVFRRLEAVIAVNPAIADLFRRFSLPQSRIHFIPPHTMPGPPAETMSAELRAFFDDHRPVLVSVGLLEPEYDLPMQIQVLGRIRGRFPGAGLLLIGSGSLHSELSALISRSPHASHILLAGDVSHRMTLRAIADSDVLLRTTQYDGDSIAVREALSFGTPVIATDNSMRPPGVHLIPVGDLDALCTATEQILAAGKPRGDGMESAPAEDNIAAVLSVYREISG